MKGLDLERYHEDVRRLALSHPAYQRAVAEGMDGDDLYQDIVRSILTRNEGSHPYDPTRSKMSTWVWQVIRSVSVNKLDSHRLRCGRELLAEGSKEVLVTADAWEVVACGRAPTYAHHMPQRDNKVTVVRARSARRVMVRNKRDPAFVGITFRCPTEVLEAVKVAAKEGHRTRSSQVLMYVLRGLREDGYADDS